MAKFSTQKLLSLKRNHGFLKRSATKNGRLVLKRRRAKNRSKLTQ